MKTLDEVIEAHEICAQEQSCVGCPNIETDIDGKCLCGDCTRDALHYLKEYQRDKQIFSYDVAKRNLELSERNEPLTIDDMKNMNGEPVWDSNNGRWYLIHWVDDDTLTAYLYSDEGVQVWRDDETLKAKPMYRMKK